MTPTILALLIAVAVLVLAIGGLILDRLAGPDPDLITPWAPGDPRPGARRRPCLDERCRVDHEAIWSNRKVW